MLALPFVDRRDWRVPENLRPEDGMWGYWAQAAGPWERSADGVCFHEPRPAGWFYPPCPVFVGWVVGPVPESLRRRRA